MSAVVDVALNRVVPGPIPPLPVVGKTPVKGDRYRVWLPEDGANWIIAVLEVPPPRTRELIEAMLVVEKPLRSSEPE